MSNKKTLTLLAFICLIGFILRFYGLTINSFWYDELFTINWLHTSLIEKINIFIEDNHPPFFYILTYIWYYIFGDTQVVLRLFPVLIGTITIPISYFLFSKIFNKHISLILALLIALLPSHIYYSQELRSYILIFLLSLITIYQLFAYIESPTARARWLLSLSCLALLSSHYVSIFFIATVWLIAISQVNSIHKNRFRLASSLSINILLLIFPLIIDLLIKRTSNDSFWLPPLSYEIIIKTLMSIVRWDVTVALVILLALLAALFNLLVIDNRADKKRLWIITILCILPFMMTISISLVFPNFTLLIPRIMMIFAAPIIIMSALGIASLKPILRLMIIATYTISCMVSLFTSQYYSQPTKSDFRAVSQEITKHIEQDNALVISLDADWLINKYYKYYLGDKAFSIIRVDENAPIDEPEKIARHIFMLAQQKNTHQVVLFAAHHPYYQNIIGICDRYFKRVSIASFSGISPHSTILAVYQLPSLNK